MGSSRATTAGDSSAGSDAPVLVTGATGFLGGYVVRALLERGNSVRATGRNLKTGLNLERLGAEFLPVDLTHREAVIASCKNVSAVVHAGAMSTAWGRYSDFFSANVTGTANVIAGCKLHGVGRIVHISSPSVLSKFKDQFDLTESEPFPADFVSTYSETKKLSEDLVNAACRDGLNTVIVRPKAIYGRGDNALLPRLVDAMSKDRLPIIGDGNSVTNFTHVTDVARSVLAALDSSGARGATYVVTGGEDVRIWDLVSEIAERLGYPPPSKRMSVSRAMGIARAMETTWKSLSLRSEPPLTRYKVGVLAHSQTYDTTAAREALGWEPLVTIKEGLDEVVEIFKASPRTRTGRTRAGNGAQPKIQTASFRDAPESSPPRLAVTFLNAGAVRTYSKFFIPGGAWKVIDIPSMFAVIEHPLEGIVLFDTGYTPRFYEATRHFPHRLYRIATPVSVSTSETAVAQLKERGIAPQDVAWIVLSHFDPDHYGGLKDFPRARIVCSWKAWESIVGKSGINALVHRILPGHLPGDMAARLHLLGDVTGPPVGPFPASTDLFEDGTIKVVELPGHAPGQIGAFVRSQQGLEYFLAADALWSRANIAGRKPAGGIHGVIAKDRKEQIATYKRLQDLRMLHPNIVIVPSHCPEAAGEVLNDPRWARAAASPT